MTDQEIRSKIKDLNLKVPFWAKGEKLQEAYDLILQGATQAEVDELFPEKKEEKPKAEKPKQESAPKEEAKAEAKKEVTAQKMYTQAELDAAISRALALSSVSHTPTQVLLQEKDKPTEFSNSLIPADDWAEEPMRVFCPGNNWRMTFFQIGGRKEPVPYARMITFRDYEGAGTNRFGDSNTIAYKQYVDVSSKKMQAMFRQDERMGSWFWLEKAGDTSSDREKFGTIFATYHRSLESTPAEAVRRMCIDAGLPTGDLSTMRVSLATHNAEKKLGLVMHTEKAQSAEKRKDELFQKAGE